MAKEGGVQWDDKSITGSMSKLFKLKDGQVARISVLSKDAFMVYDHYSSKARRHGRCIRSVGMCPGCGVLGEPRERFAAKILIYETNLAGELTKPLRFQLSTWVFSADKFVELRNIRKQWGDLRARDLMVTCPKGGEKFQKMSFVPTPKCIWRAHGKVTKKVLEMVKSDKTDLESILGKVLPAEELSKRLGLELEPGTFEEADLTEFSSADDVEVTVKPESGDVKVGDAELDAELDVDLDAELEDAVGSTDTVKPESEPKPDDIDLSDIDAALDDI